MSQQPVDCLGARRDQDSPPLLSAIGPSFPVVGGIDGLLQSTVGDGIELQTFLDPRLLPVSADPGQMVQVLPNLAMNAAEAMPDGGSLAVETARPRQRLRHHPPVRPDRHRSPRCPALARPSPYGCPRLSPKPRP